MIVIVTPQMKVPSVVTMPGKVPQMAPASAQELGDLLNKLAAVLKAPGR